MFNQQELGPFSFSNNNTNVTTKLGSQHNRPIQNAMMNNNGSGDNQQQIDKTKLIVNYIPQFATEEDLALIFKQVGRVESIKIMRDYNTGYSFGFGFVKYFTPEDAAKAIDAINGMNFRNKRLKVSYSRPPGSDMKDSNLYITNLPKEITEEDIDKLFGEFGEIVQRTVLRDKITGLPRGVAFVRFSKGEEAQAAIAKLDGKLLENAMFPLSVRVAEDHGRQKAQFLEPMWAAPFMPNRGTLDQPRFEKTVFQVGGPVRPEFKKSANKPAQMRQLRQTVQTTAAAAAGMAPFRGVMNFRELPRGNFPNRFGRFANFNAMRNMGAGDNFFQNPFYF